MLTICTQNLKWCQKRWNERHKVANSLLCLWFRDVKWHNAGLKWCETLNNKWSKKKTFGNRPKCCSTEIFWICKSLLRLLLRHTISSYDCLTNNRNNISFIENANLSSQPLYWPFDSYLIHEWSIDLEMTWNYNWWLFNRLAIVGLGVLQWSWA